MRRGDPRTHRRLQAGLLPEPTTGICYAVKPHQHRSISQAHWPTQRGWRTHRVRRELWRCCMPVSPRRAHRLLSQKRPSAIPNPSSPRALAAGIHVSTIESADELTMLHHNLRNR